MLITLYSTPQVLHVYQAFLTIDLCLSSDTVMFFYISKDRKLYLNGIISSHFLKNNREAQQFWLQETETWAIRFAP